jgi:hypothetical protein
MFIYYTALFAFSINENYVVSLPILQDESSLYVYQYFLKAQISET